MDLVFATNNKHKLEEIQQLIGVKINLKSLSDINCSDEIPEDFFTLEENASQKANYIFNKYNMDCFADDTGLEIEALKGDPGVLSARYAGESKDSEANMKKVLEKLKGEKNRNARFRTVISLIIDKKEYFFEGIVNGEILEGKTGKDGFGYDPIFMPTGYSESFAEMSIDEKNLISHRAIATKKLVGFLLNL
ncbi:MAG: non-canonical purine NTP diphosphatase [Bacteroidales bacterium]|nr:non-canonical purine NTP diphosphatase [Bacteroidales bacterium]